MKYSRVWTVRVVVVLLIGTVSVSGCGRAGGRRPVAKVSGQVIYKGQVVTSGTVTLAPVSSGKSSEADKPGLCSIQPDGSFQASTYGRFDGALIGKHRVMYSAPSPVAPVAPEGGHAQAPPPSPYEGMVAVVREVEVKAGENTFNIELVAGNAIARFGNPSGVPVR